MVSTRRKVTVCVVGAMCASAPPAEGFTPPGCSGEKERAHGRRLPARACITSVGCFYRFEFAVLSSFEAKRAANVQSWAFLFFFRFGLELVWSYIKLISVVNPSFSWSDAILLVDTLFVLTLISSSFVTKKRDC